jgi:hypothetical protein
MSAGDGCAKCGVVRLGPAGSSTAFKSADELSARFDFGGRFGGDGYPSVSLSQQMKFQADFLAQVGNVLAQLHKYKWLARDAILPARAASGPYQPAADFHVFVSEIYDKSRSLVPAWCGQRGWMEFPAYRVVGGDASIAHELTHVLFPNGNRMLAEGLAVYLQDKVCDVPVYPNFGDPPEDLITVFLMETYKSSALDMLWQMNLDAFEQISTPDELGLSFGAEMIGARPGFGLKDGDDQPPPEEGRTVYAVAGSLVGFLLDNPIQDDLLTEKNFGALYGSTPLRPYERSSGAPDRWRDCYGGKPKSYSFSDIGLLWKTYMHVKFLGAGKKIPEDFASIPLVATLAKQLTGKAGARRRTGK